MAIKTKKKGKTTEEIRDTVTSRIITALEEGTIPWERDYKVIGGVHKNWASKKPYRGINQFLLDLTAQISGYSSPYWLSSKQAFDESYKQYRKANNLQDTPEAEAAHKREGYKAVRKGEKATLVTFTKRIVKTEDDNKTPVLDKNGKPVIIWLLRYFNVFNAEQTDLNLPVPGQDELRDHDPIAAAEGIVKGYDGPKIIEGGNAAFYIPTADEVHVPLAEQFNSAESYYHTTFHELTHSTGHKSRLNRPAVQDPKFGSEPYAKEELVAEIGAAILSGHANIDVPKQQDRTASYIKHWIKALKDDNNLILKAGGEAQRAVDIILDTKFEEN
jgi:antirestriction protein ArdC